MVSDENTKYQQYLALREKILNCRKCDLWRNRTNAVPGEGDLNSIIMFIGEAPGRQEDIEGRPFVGPAGKLLTSLLESIGLRRELVYITNVVKCRPPGNRDPKPIEISSCAPYLNAEIKIIRPKLIVTLGRHSSSYIFSLAGMSISGISKIRGSLRKIRLFDFDVLVLPTYHPAAALYNPRLKDALQEDFKKMYNIVSQISEGSKGLIRGTKGRQSSLDEFFN